MARPGASPELDAAASGIRSVSCEKGWTLVELWQARGLSSTLEQVTEALQDACRWFHRSPRMHFVLVEPGHLDPFLEALRSMWRCEIHPNMAAYVLQLPEGPRRSAFALSKVTGWLREERAKVPFLRTSDSKLWMVADEAFIEPLSRNLFELWSKPPADQD